MRPTVAAVPWDNAAAEQLRAELAAEVGPRYADRIPDALRDSTNAVDPDSVFATLLAFDDDEPVGHAAIRWNADDLELKRMYVRPSHRGTDTARVLLAAVESAARAAGVARLILQTGDRQPDAIRFYERSGYQPISAFAPYQQLPFSRCYGRTLATDTVSPLRRWRSAAWEFLSSPIGVRTVTASVI